MMNVDERLERLLAIINLQAELGWREYFHDDRNNIFHYFRSLGLLSRDEQEAIYAGRRRLTASHVLHSYWTHVDYHFSSRYYAGEAVVDVGAGWGALTFWLLVSGARRAYPVGDEKRTLFVRRLFEAAIQAKLLPGDTDVVPIPRLIRVGQTRFGDEIPDGSAALVLFNDVFEHITPRIMPFVLGACHRALAPG